MNVPEGYELVPKMHPLKTAAILLFTVSGVVAWSWLILIIFYYNCKT